MDEKIWAEHIKNIISQRLLHSNGHYFFFSYLCISRLHIFDMIFIPCDSLYSPQIFQLLDNYVSPLRMITTYELKGFKIKKGKVKQLFTSGSVNTSEYSTGQT